MHVFRKKRLGSLCLVVLAMFLFGEGVWCGLRWGVEGGETPVPTGLKDTPPHDAQQTATGVVIPSPSGNTAVALSEDADTPGAVAQTDSVSFPDGKKAPPTGPDTIAPLSGTAITADAPLNLAKRTPADSIPNTDVTSPQGVGAECDVLVSSPSTARENSVRDSSERGTGTPSTHSTVKAAMPFTPSLSSFCLHRLGDGNGPTLLVVGGIQGDEPGGFSAASLLASQYSVSGGSVWVVPGLNFHSILQRDRGVFGDMNRKFAAIDPDDPEYETVERIKEVLLSDDVAIVLNLHDGSGFYRPEYVDALRNPKRWGQSLIIDKDVMEGVPYGDLRAMAAKAEQEINTRLLDAGHRYHIHNTRTAEGNVEMAKTLSWFAVRNGKPAFGIEASKEFGTDRRVYYHLQVIEAYMRILGMQYTRDFDLTPKGVLTALNSNLKVTAYDNRLVLDLDNVRPTLAMVPMKRGTPRGKAPEQRSSKPLLALVPDSAASNWRVAYGNRTLTRLSPEFLDFDESLETVEMVLDGKTRTVKLGDIVHVSDSFLVKGEGGYRVNAIGAKKEVNGTEADVILARKDFLPRFSVDKSATTYRVEIYKDKAFAGMVLVRFGELHPVDDATPLTATGGPESDLGF